MDELTKLPHHGNIISNFIIDLEDKLHIREDFVDIYENVLIHSDKAIRKRFLSAENSYYYTIINSSRNFASKYGIYNKLMKNVKKPISELESLSEIVGFIDSLLTLGIALGFVFSIGMYVVHIPDNKIISYISAIFTIFLAIVKLILYGISKSETMVRELLKRLIITPALIRADKRGIHNKDKLIASYIWDFSLIHNTNDTIRGFLILLLLKFVSKNMFMRVKLKLIKLTPDYISKRRKEKSNFGFLLHVLKNSFN
jgi:hypothetical protein